LQTHISLLLINSKDYILPQIQLGTFDLNEHTSIPYIIMKKADFTLKTYFGKVKINFEKVESIINQLLDAIQLIHDH